MENKQPTEGNPQLELSPQELEKATNEYYGYEGPSDEQPEVEVEEAPETEAVQAEPAGEAQKTEETATQDSGQSFDSLKPFLDDTPFKGEDIVKGVESLAKSYKALQAEFTPLSQKVKPFKDVLERADKDPVFKQNLLLASEMLTNPKMMEAYQAQQMGRPDPTQYDLYTPEGRSAYDKAEEDYIARQLDSRINQRFAQLEQDRIRERHVSELRATFPDANPEDVMRFAQENVKDLNLTDFHKLASWDAREAQITEKVRKELTSKLQQAQESKTPQATAPKDTIKVNDVMKYMASKGFESAVKKYGDEVVTKVLQASTNATWSS